MFFGGSSMELEKKSLRAVRIGGHFFMDEVEFVKMDCWMSQVLVVAAHTFAEPSVFALLGDGNGFSESTAMVDVEKWMEKRTAISNNSIKHHIDLTALDGSKCCGKPVVGSRLLTLEEYRKYRDVIPRTGWRRPDAVLNVRVTRSVWFCLTGP